MPEITRTWGLHQTLQMCNFSAFNFKVERVWVFPPGGSTGRARLWRKVPLLLRKTRFSQNRPQITRTWGLHQNLTPPWGLHQTEITRTWGLRQILKNESWTTQMCRTTLILHTYIFVGMGRVGRAGMGRAGPGRPGPPPLFISFVYLLIYVVSILIHCVFFCIKSYKPELFHPQSCRCSAK